MGGAAATQAQRPRPHHLKESIRIPPELVLLVNDLHTPIEVQRQDDTAWQVVYPCSESRRGQADEPDLTGCLPLRAGEIEIRLREAPDVVGRRTLEEMDRMLFVSEDFGRMSAMASEWDAQLLKAQRREANRRRDVESRQRARIEQEAQKMRDKATIRFVCATGFALTLLLALLLLCSVIAPDSAPMAALLVSGAVFAYTCISLCCIDHQLGHGQFRFGSNHSNIKTCSSLACCSGFVALVVMMVLHGLGGYWWTALIVLPSFCCFFVVGVCVCVDLKNSSYFSSDGESKVEEEKSEAERRVLQRTIVFEGSVMKTGGRPCVCSWPGKYESAWDALVNRARDGQVSAAVVFLPEGTKDHGKHDSIPRAHGLPGECCAFVWAAEALGLPLVELLDRQHRASRSE